MDILAGVILAIVCILGTAITLLTLPGTWIILFVAILIKWWQPELLSWWAIGIAAGLCVLGELLEFFASAAGAAKVGGTRWGAGGSIIGGLLGAILGTGLIPIPIVGTILGASIGAGLGAMAGERYRGREWGEATQVAAGAATGRLIATIAKGACAVVESVVLMVWLIVNAVS